MSDPCWLLQAYCWCPPHNKLFLFPRHGMLFLNTCAHTHTNTPTPPSLSWMPFLYSIRRLPFLPLQGVCVCVCARLVVQSCQTLRPHGLQHTRLPCPSLRVCSNSCLFSREAMQPSHPLSPPSGAGYHFLLQKIFLIKGWKNPGLLHWLADSLPLSYWEAHHYSSPHHVVIFSFLTDKSSVLIPAWPWPGPSRYF